MEEVQISKNQLPDNLQDLSKFALIGREKLNAVKAEIRAIQKVGLAKEVHEQKLQEAQEIAEAVLDAEVKIGELTEKMKQGINRYSSNNGVTPKHEQLNSIGMSKMQASRFETLANHPEAVETAKAEARESGEIVTRQSVFDKIRKRNPIKQAIIEAQEEHEAFSESKAQGVVDFTEAQKDKINTELLAENAKFNIYKVVKQVGDIGLMKLETLEDMAKSLSDDEADELEKKLRKAVDVLSMIWQKIEEAR